MIGARLKEERNRLGLTQPDFAAAAGAAKRTLIEWEKGETSPNAVQLSALKKIGVDVLYVLTGDSPDLRQTMAAYAGSPEGRQLLHDVTLGNVPGNPPDRPSAADALPQGCIDEAVVYQAVIDAVDLLSLEAKLDAQQFAKAVVKLCLRKAG